MEKGKLLLSARERCKEEYEIQFFGFSAREIIIGLTEHIYDSIEHQIGLMKKSLENTNKFDQIVLQEKLNALINLYGNHLEKNWLFYRMPSVHL